MIRGSDIKNPVIHTFLPVLLKAAEESPMVLLPAFSFPVEL